MRNKVDFAGAVVAEHADLGAGKKRQANVAQHPLAARKGLRQTPHHVDVLIGHEWSPGGLTAARDYLNEFALGSNRRPAAGNDEPGQGQYLGEQEGAKCGAIASRREGAVGGARKQVND